uniref:Protein kinase domain-containing protein n=1 Tax=Heterorhabditis bacteriophora TaxID=37862 RepID=A0A1I7XMG9_HETBA
MKSEDFSHENDEKPIDLSLFIDLMEQFYSLGWMRGTGGAMGCISGNQLMISPSALQKERLRESDIFVYDIEMKTVVQRPLNSKIGVSSCSVLFSLIMKQTGSECVIHTHAKAANLITQLLKSNSFEISHQEYIKGIYDPFTGKNLEFEDTITIPIIANKPKEHLLLPGLEEALKSNPRGCAVLVRNHGLFVWGPTWEQTKVMSLWGQNLAVTEARSRLMSTILQVNILRELDEKPPFDIKKIESIRSNVKFDQCYETSRQIGDGKFGKVFQVKEKSTGQEFAAKFIRIRKEADRQEVEREVSILTQLQHPRIAQIYDAFYTTTNDLIFCRVRGGELFDRVADENYVLTEQAVVMIICQLCEAIEYIHQRNILHLDIKVLNRFYGLILYIIYKIYSLNIFSKRMLPKQCLIHPWIAKHRSKARCDAILEKPGEGPVMDNKQMMRYNAKRKFRRMIIYVKFLIEMNRLRTSLRDRMSQHGQKFFDPLLKMAEEKERKSASDAKLATDFMSLASSATKKKSSTISRPTLKRENVLPVDPFIVEKKEKITPAILIKAEVANVVGDLVNKVMANETITDRKKPVTVKKADVCLKDTENEQSTKKVSSKNLNAERTSKKTIKLEKKQTSCDNIYTTGCQPSLKTSTGEEKSIKKQGSLENKQRKSSLRRLPVHEAIISAPPKKTTLGVPKLTTTQNINSIDEKEVPARREKKLHKSESEDSTKENRVHKDRKPLRQVKAVFQKQLIILVMFLRKISLHNRF